MFRTLRILAHCIATALYAVKWIVILFLVLILITPPGWPMIPIVAIIVRQSILEVRKRRGFAVLEQVREAIRLNLPLPPLLSAGVTSRRDPYGRRLTEVAQLLTEGFSVANALNHSVRELPARDMQMIKASERFGRLPQSLDRLLKQHQVAVERQSAEVTRVSAYTVVVISIMLIIISGIMTLIVPKFEKIFDDFQTRIPTTTLVLMNTSKWLGGRLPDQVVPGFVWILLAGFLALLIRVSRWTVPGRLLTDPILWWLPVIHDSERDRGMGDVCHLMEEALHAGVPIHVALAEASDLRMNTVLQRRVRRWSKQVAAGLSVADAAREARMPEMAVGMLGASQETASLPDVLGFLGRYYDSRFSRTAAILQGAAAPVTVLCFAMVVGWIVISLFLPLVALITKLTG